MRHTSYSTVFEYDSTFAESLRDVLRFIQPHSFVQSPHQHRRPFHPQELLEIAIRRQRLAIEVQRSLDSLHEIELGLGRASRVFVIVALGP